jgi:tRNA pseudouridine(38-40) synthase
LAYDGTKYFGYQQQNEPTTKTVEDDLDIAFGRKLLGAGRTDKDVSALSQVISFSTFEDIDSETLLTSIRASEPFVSNRLAVWDCIRLPRKFHPVFCATWRRYLYLFPVSDGIYGEGKIDVDLPFINRCLERSVFLHSFRILLHFNVFKYYSAGLLIKLFLSMVLHIEKTELSATVCKTIAF